MRILLVDLYGTIKHNRGEKKKNYNQDLPKVTTSSAFNKSF